MKLSDKIKTLLFAGVLVAAGVGGVAINADDVDAASASEQISSGMQATGLQDGNTTDASTIITTIVNAMLYIVGVLSVIMIIYGGITYTTSAGDSAKVTKAKNIILYGIVGLVISVLAYAIVNFVLTKLSGDSATTGV